ncbi:MAG: VOC family protein [Myxococcales bacterium]
MARYGEGAHGPKGSVMTVKFQLEGQEFLALNGGPLLKFTEAISLVVNCETQQELDEIWDKLCAGGQPSQCGWLKDKYGLSWQLVPTALGNMLQDGPRAAKVMQALLQMRKLDIARLKEAYQSA